MSAKEPQDVRAIMLEGTAIQWALRESWIKTLNRHKRLGNPIVVWHDGKVVWIPADEIEIPETKPGEEEPNAVPTPLISSVRPISGPLPSFEGSLTFAVREIREGIGMLPEFDEFGNLPPGIHRATIEEIVLRFGIGAPERDVEGQELLEFVKWAKDAGVNRLIVDGSFVTSKETPNDVDLVILPGPDYPRGKARAHGEDDVSWPFLHVLIAADDEDLERWVIEDFGTDRLLRSKGVVEVIL